MDASHLEPDRLAALAVRGGREPAHLAGCAECRGELDRFRRLVAELRDAEDAPPDLLEAAKGYFRRRRRLEDLIERLASEPALRLRAKSRPDEVIRQAGLEPSPALIEAIREGARVSGDLARRLAAFSVWH